MSVHCRDCCMNPHDIGRILERLSSRKAEPISFLQSSSSQTSEETAVETIFVSIEKRLSKISIHGQPL